MSKNLTRKGLALGAAVALGSTLFAGAPALAAAGLIVAPDSGTGYTVLASDTFKLRVVGNTDYTMATTSDLIWKVTQPVAASVSITGTLDNSNTAVSENTATVKYFSANATATSTPNTLTITPTIGATDGNQDYIVQAFIENGQHTGYQAAEDVIASSPVTVKFVQGANLTSVTTIDAVSAGQAVTGTVKYSNTDFNYAQSFESSTKTTYVLANKDGGVFGDATPTTLSDAKDSFEYSVSVTGAVAAGSIIGVKSRVTGYASDSTYTNSAAVYSTADSASSALAETTSISSGENIKKSSSGVYLVRTGTKAFSYRVDFYKEAGKVNLVGAGKAVRITVSEDTSTDPLTTGDVIRVNGKALTGSATGDQTAVLNTLTDANGGITVSVESDLAAVSDKISIAVLATGSTGAITSTNSFTWTDAAASSFTAVESQAGGNGSTTNAPDLRTIVKGSSVTLKYAIRDQFGKLWAPAGYDYRVNVAKGGTGSLTLATTAAFSGGLATVTYTDNTTAANATTTVVATLESKLSTGTSYGTVGVTDAGINSSSDDLTESFNIVSSAQAAAKITMNAAVDNASATVSDADGVADATNKVTKSDVSTLKAIDLRSNANGSSLANSYGAKLSGTVFNADGSQAAGVPVTVSATGVYFSTLLAGSAYVTADTITVNTNSNGTYNVWAFTKKGGAFPISITSGSVTKTQNVKWVAASATSGTTIAITAPSNSLPGRTVDVVVLLTDKNGAPVQTTTNGVERLSVALTGPGSNTAIAATTDADGKLSFKLIFGANDLGTASVKVTYDADGDATVYAPVVSTKVIEVSSTLPSTTTAAVAGSTKRFFVSVSGNTGAKNVVVKVAGKTVATLKGSASAKTYTVKATKGSKKVTVYVGGKLIATKTVSVK